MPKENKRFINPLLRPSQDTPQGEQELVSSSVKEDDAPVSTQEASQAQGQVAQARASSVKDIEPEQLRPAVETPSFIDSDIDSDSSNSDAATSDSHTQGEQAVNKSRLTAVDDVTAARGRSTEVDATRSSRSPAAASRSSAKVPSSPSLNGKGARATKAVRETSYARADESELGEDRLQGYRRRVEVRFEHMHERLTVWIDRELKRGLEDLASRRNLSKTALINEAMADLLKKYDED